MTQPSASVRRPILAGNWKMHKTPAETRIFLTEFRALYAPLEDRTVIFFPPALSVAAAREARGERADLHLGVQNIHWEKEGAFTGEISAAMAMVAGAEFVLVGHSERRHVFGESDEDVARKTAAAIDHGLQPVICIGERLEERRSNRLEAVLARQLDAVLDVLPDAAGSRSWLLAYEPVWAIGTGVNATPADAAAAHGFIRGRIAARLGADLARRTPILYGGSVKPDNAADLLAATDVDGLLVGGASLDPTAFARIAAVATA